jgi:hypothetical protein
MVEIILKILLNFDCKEIKEPLTGGSSFNVKLKKVL